MEERISWSMPNYWKKHNIIHFAASKKHIGLYPGPAAVAQFSEELQGYKTDKGTIRIPYGKVDAALIEKIANRCKVCYHKLVSKNTGAGKLLHFFLGGKYHEQRNEQQKKK